MASIDVHLEVGSARTFATAIDWPGWSRAGRDGDAAVAALAAYAQRYTLAMRSSGLPIKLPRDLSAYAVVERVTGDASTDFGVPGTAPTADALPVDDRSMDRLVALWRAAWRAFDQAVEAATGQSLRTGPRGGGRDLAKIRAHVLDAEAGYLTSLGGKAPAGGSDDIGWDAEVREAAIEALGARVRGELPDRGPRGGRRWSPRYAVRRSAWHALDHAWEIEDRTPE